MEKQSFVYIITNYEETTLDRLLQCKFLVGADT